VDLGAAIRAADDHRKSFGREFGGCRERHLPHAGEAVTETVHLGPGRLSIDHDLHPAQAPHA
jgi:hypothetical protein